MSYSVLGINPGHNGSAALIIDGKIVYYCEEERISRMKYDGNPFRAMLYVLDRYPVDEIVIGGTTAELPVLPWTMEDPYTALARKYNPKIKSTNLGHQHHLGHAAGAFYNSGFDTALAIIVDGAGSKHTVQIDEQGNTVSGYETESVYKCSYTEEFQPLYKRYADGNAFYYNNGVQEFDNSVTITKAYEAVSQHLGFGFIEAGKTMGLAPYGRADDTIPNLFVNGRGNKNALIPRYPAGAFIDTTTYPNLQQTRDPKVWHRDFTQVTDTEKNLAWRVQDETQRLIGDLIERAAAVTGETNIVIAGGYGLNCVANYYYQGRFPNLNIYVDPISHDGGTSVGLAKLAWYAHSKSLVKEPLTTLYLGAQPDYFDFDTRNIPDNFSMLDATAKDVAELLFKGNIVAMFQGAAEAGPRALGNRSIMFDPRRADGKDYVNKVKGREWFRPFAGSALIEHAHEWFDLRGLDESPFMMYAVNLTAAKIGQLPAITHVDGTCRVQTVKRMDNPAYYDVINAFYDLTGVPVVFNTSFNLAGEPLVETVDDAIHTLQNCDISYVYMPTIMKLLVKQGS